MTSSTAKTLRLLFSILLIGSSTITLEAKNQDLNYGTLLKLNQHNGLSSAKVYAIQKDHKGFMWLGTDNGINRYNGHSIKSYKTSEQSNSLWNNSVSSIHITATNLLLAGTNNGLNQYCPKSDTFQRLYITPDQKTNPKIFSIAEAADGTIWTATSEGLFSLKGGTFEALEVMDDQLKGEPIQIFSDHNGTLWVGAYNKGLYFYNPQNRRLEKFSTDPQGHEPDIKHVVKIEQGPNKDLWLATWGDGLWQISPDEGAVKVYRHDAHQNSPNSNYLKALKFDQTGKLWIGYEEAGLDCYDPKEAHFFHYYAPMASTALFEEPSIYSLFVDNESILWMGFRNDGLQAISLKDNPFKLWTYPGDDSYQVFCLLETSYGLLAGTRQALDLINTTTGTFQRYPLPNGETPVAFSIYKSQEALVATYNDNIYRFNLLSGKFSKYWSETNYSPDTPLKIRMLQMHQDQLLVGTEKQLLQIDPTDPAGHPDNLLNAWIHSCIADHGAKDLWLASYNQKLHRLGNNGEVDTIQLPISGDLKSLVKHQNEFFLGTDLGLFIYDIQRNSIKQFQTIFPYQNLQINAIEKDKAAGIWASSLESILFYDRITELTRSFNHSDLLPTVRYNDGVSALLNDGRIVFGGKGGIVIFNPLDFKPEANSAHLAFTNLKIQNQSVYPGKKNSPIEKNISETQLLTLKNNQNTFTLEFSLLSYTNQSKHRYQYQLSGINQNWIDLDHQNHVTFTQLKKGKYLLKVRAANQDNAWSKENTIQVVVLPPYYLSWYAYIVYFLLGFGLFYSFLKLYKARLKIQNDIKTKEIQLANLQKLADQENQFHQMKLEFFTNISHEFRTPLSLIVAPLESFMMAGKSPDRESMENMHRNADRLNRMVTQLLDFRKIEVGKLTLDLINGDLVSFCRQKVLLFTPLAFKKELRFHIDLPEQPLMVWFDADKLEKIIFNLLSNAFKFTNQGSVNFSLKIIQNSSEEVTETENNTPPLALLKVSDTGVGIKQDKAPFVFDRFYSQTSHQSPSAQNQQSTGIGLSLTKEMVELHQGYISYQPKQPRGSVFTVKLPLNLLPADEKHPSVATSALPADNKLTAAPAFTVNEGDAKEKPRMLIVEDNQELRQFIKKEFDGQFSIALAENGKKGLEISLKEIPDIIISDLMMPEMDGITMCETLRSNEITSHIPLIILTANESPASKIKSFKLGIDDYITKPFSIEMLRHKVNGLLKNRELLQKKFSKELRMEPTGLAITNVDEAFLIKAMEVVQEHLSDEEFSADHFADKMAMSRVHLYRKLKSLTGESVSDFVKTIRLKLAADLIRNKKVSIKETAYMVGFSDPKYFSKCFKQQFGIKPSDYAEQELV